MRLLSALFSVCLLALAGCGGGGSGGNSANTTASATTPTSPPTTAPTPTPTRSGNMIFVGDNRNYVMAAVDTLTPKPGTLTAKIFSTTATTWLGAAFDGARDELYVSAWSRIDVYANASKLDGNINASRSIIPNMSDVSTIGVIGGIQRVILDKANDRIYASFKSTARDGIAVFENASKLDGTVTPSRIITGSFDVLSFAIDFKRNVMYSCWSHGSPCDVFVFENIDTAKGNIEIARRSRIPTFVKGFAIDSARDRLYMVSNNGTVLILDSASTATGDARITSLVLPTMRAGSAITVDTANDRLYAGFSEQVFVLNDASKLNASSSAAQAVAITVPGNAAISYFAVPQ